MPPRETPVLIVGAGPVGLTAALVLSQLRTPCRIIDKSMSPTDISKALVIWRRSLQCLDPFLPMETFLENHSAVRGVNFFSDGKQRAHLLFAEDGRGDPPGVFIPQYDTEKILIDALASHDVTVERDVELQSFQHGEDGVTVTLGKGNETETVQVPWLLACDGGHSTVRKKLGLSFPGESTNRRWLIADVGIQEETRMDELMIETAAQGAVACFPIGPQRWRIICDDGLVEEDAQLAPVTLEQIQQVLSERTSWGWHLTESFWLSEFRVNERQVEQYRHGRIFLAGDAAHVHSPAGGQGMNTGIQDAINLAWKLAMVHAGKAPEALLNTYQAERHPVGAMVVKGTAALMRNWSKTGHVARGVRSILVPLATSIGPVRRKIIGMLTEDSVSYREGPLAGIRREHASHGPGDGFPDRLVSVSGLPSSSTCLLRDVGPTVVIFGEQCDLGSLSFGLEGNGLPIAIKRVGPGGDAEDPKGALAHAMGLTDGGMVLVRPDGVIAAVGDTVAELSAWCQDRLMPASMAW
ncbi:MAG: FAD-dependent monooxygenase [Phycisphaerales bacterium]|nr:FAD-dependent monooxygenase [Phycisphaerales bacterium]